MVRVPGDKGSGDQRTRRSRMTKKRPGSQSTRRSRISATGPGDQRIRQSLDRKIKNQAAMGQNDQRKRRNSSSYKVSAAVKKEDKKRSKAKKQIRKMSMINARRQRYPLSGSSTRTGFA